MSHIPTFVSKSALLNMSLIIFIGYSASVSENALAQTPITLASSTAPQMHQDEQSASYHIYDFTMDDIDGNPRKLSDFKGKVMLVVSTARFCGNTPQPEGLQTLYAQYRKEGLTILAFPANDFGRQEPGDNKKIAKFCYTQYTLEFPLFSKSRFWGKRSIPSIGISQRTRPLKEKSNGISKSF